MSSVPVIITGAAGRMGTMLCTMATAEPDRFTLAGVVERPEFLDKLAQWRVPAESSLDALLAKLSADVRQNCVVIDFTAPEVSLENARIVAKYNAALVIGTTGLSKEHTAELEQLAATARLFWSPNMSIGINVLLRLLPELVRMLGDAYDLEVMEIHHNKKKDAPSGTALALGKVLAQAKEWDFDAAANYHREGMAGERPQREIGMQTLRGGDVTGIHTVYCLGPGERIEVSHHAHSRENFAQGALRAAAWLPAQKPGKLYSMLDVLASAAV